MKKQLGHIYLISFVIASGEAIAKIRRWRILVLLLSYDKLCSLDECTDTGRTQAYTWKTQRWRSFMHDEGRCIEDNIVQASCHWVLLVGNKNNFFLCQSSDSFCGIRVVSPRKVSRFAPRNHYYIIIDEVFFDNFW